MTASNSSDQDRSHSRKPSRRAGPPEDKEDVTGNGENRPPEQRSLSAKGTESLEDEWPDDLDNEAGVDGKTLDPSASPSEEDGHSRAPDVSSSENTANSAPASAEGSTSSEDTATAKDTALPGIDTATAKDTGLPGIDTATAKDPASTKDTSPAEDPASAEDIGSTFSASPKGTTSFSDSRSSKDIAGPLPASARTKSSRDIASSKENEIAATKLPSSDQLKASANNLSTDLDIKNALAELRQELEKERNALQQERDFLKNKRDAQEPSVPQIGAGTKETSAERAKENISVDQAPPTGSQVESKSIGTASESPAETISEKGTASDVKAPVSQAVPAPPRESATIPPPASGTASGTTFAPVVCNLSPTGAPLYDAKLADQAVLPSRIVNDKRFWRMARTVISLSKAGAKNKWFPDKELTEKERRTAFAFRFREALVEFGPTFIKLGQFLSVRRDFLTPEMADELATLQDKVPPFESEIVQQTIEKELGKRPEQLFAEFDYQPIASASIGQVHKAILKDGRLVVVKVQRPDLAQRFYQDLGYMRTFIRWGRRLRPDGEWDSWLALSDEFGRTLFSEIDYLQEGKNADRMRVALKDQYRVRIPRVIWRHTGRHVLTLEYAPGIKIDQIEELKSRGFELEEIGNELIYCYLEQVLIHGFFHADPHAGNLAIDDEGKIIIYDFGMMGEISAAQRMAIAGCVTSVIEKKGENVAAHLVELGVLREDAAKVQVIRTLGPFIDYYSGKSVRELDFTDLERDIDQIALERALRLPANLAYLLRAGSSLEGIARTLQPNFSFVEAAKPFIQKWLLREPTAFGPLLKVFFRYGQEAYRNSAAKLSAGREIFGFGKRKTKLISHTSESVRPQSHHLPLPPKAASAKITGPSSKSTGAEKEGSPLTPVAKEAQVAKLNETESRHNQASDHALAQVLPAPDTTRKSSGETKRLSASPSAPQKIAQAKEASNRSTSELRQQIYLLETKLKKSNGQQITLSACGLVVVFLFFLESYHPEYRSYATYFLIGNGVMGAIIMWHLVVLLGKAFQEKR